MNHEKTYTCEECGDKSEHKRKWAIIHNHLLCGFCKRKKSFPNILGKNNFPTKIHFGIKPQSGPVSILKDEAKVIYAKHIKQSGNEKEASEAVHQARFWTKLSHIKQKENLKENKSTFKKEFEKLVEVKK